MSSTFRWSETHLAITCNGCIACRVLHSVISLDSSKSGFENPQECLKTAVEHILSIYSCQAHAAFALQPVLLFVSSNKLTVCVGSIACVVWLSLFEKKKKKTKSAYKCFHVLFSSSNYLTNKTRTATTTYVCLFCFPYSHQQWKK